MVKINNVEIGLNCFPNNERILNDVDAHGSGVVVEFKYESDIDIAKLIMAKKYLDDTCMYQPPKVTLIMKYIPYSRMDRKIENHMFTLKYFCQLVNDLNFSVVYVLDAHSNVSTALLNRCVEIDVSQYINQVFKMVDVDYIFYPDAGACKRYTETLKLVSDYSYFYGNKRRNLQTGEIIEYELMEIPNDIKGKNVLIIDDLCSKGFTFYKASEKLKEQGVNEINLYVSHCENSIYNGKLLKSDYISKIFTTDSILEMWGNKKLIKLD